MGAALHAQYHVLHSPLQRLTDSRLIDFILQELLPAMTDKSQLQLAPTLTMVQLPPLIANLSPCT